MPQGMTMWSFPVSERGFPDMAFARIEGLRTLELGGRGSDLQRELNALVLAGDKIATAGHLRTDYEAEGEVPEHVGEEQFLVDADGRPILRVRYTRVEIVPFIDVSWELAQDEGEGFADIDDWRAAHRRYWRREAGIEVDDDDLIVCLWFEVAQRPATAGTSAS